MCISTRYQVSWMRLGGCAFARDVLAIVWFYSMTRTFSSSMRGLETHAHRLWEEDFFSQIHSIHSSRLRNQATLVAYRSIDLNASIILALNVRGSGLLSEHLLARVRRVPSALAFLGGLLQSIAVGTRLRKQDINLLKSATGGLWAVIPHIGSGKETADQRPDEDLRANGRNASATTEDHDPS